MVRKRWSIFSTCLLLLSVLALSPPQRSTAHPLGNFSVNHYTEIRLGPDAIELRYLLDLAEIPTFQEMQETGLVPEAGQARLRAYLAQRSETLKKGLRLTVNGHALVLVGTASEALFPSGAGGLPTLKLAFVYRATLAGVPASKRYTLLYRDENYPGRTGWQEIIAVADAGSTIQQRSVPATDRSQALTAYPTDLLNSPPQVLAARVQFTRAD